MKEAIRYRTAAEKPREAFLEHLAYLHSKHGSLAAGDDHAEQIRRIVVEEVRPAAREYKNQLQTIYDDLFGTLATGAIGYLGSSAALQIFGLSWPNLRHLAGAAGAALGAAAIKAKKEVRKAKRDYAFSFLLKLES